MIQYCLFPSSREQFSLGLYSCFYTHSHLLPALGDMHFTEHLFWHEEIKCFGALDWKFDPNGAEFKSTVFCLLPAASCDMELPYELEELVLGYLIGDTSALRNCSLTCRRFTPIAQRSLFARVEFSLSHEHTHRHPERFRSLILSSLHIANLVTSVSIIDNRYHIMDLDRGIQFHGDTHLPECLPMLTNLQNLSLESKGFWMLPWASASSHILVCDQRFPLPNRGYSAHGVRRMCRFGEPFAGVRLVYTRNFTEVDEQCTR